MAFGRLVTAGNSQAVCKQQHYPWLDWLRFLAALSVVITHARGGHWVGWSDLQRGGAGEGSALVLAIAGLDFEPVVVFFVLSGFLVGGKVMERLMAGTFLPSAYALDRFSRIYIPLLPALGLSAMAAWLAGRPISVTEFVGNLASLQDVVVRPFAGNGPLWSLSYEVWFYVIAGAGAALFSVHGLRAVLAFVLLLCGLLVFTKLDSSLLYCWLLGAAAFPLRKMRLSAAAVIPAILLLVAGVLASQLAFRNVSLPHLWLPSRHVSLLVMSGGLAVILAWLSSLPSPKRFMISFHALGASLAAFAYTLYLTHYPVLQIWRLYDPAKHAQVDVASFTLFLAKIVCCLLSAWVLYLPFERRTADFRRWVRGQLSLPTHL